MDGMGTEKRKIGGGESEVWRDIQITVHISIEYEIYWYQHLPVGVPSLKPIRDGVDLTSCFRIHLRHPNWKVLPYTYSLNKLTKLHHMIQFHSSGFF